MASYKVKVGENWTNLARKFGVELQTLIRANSGVTQPRAGVYVNVPQQGGAGGSFGGRPRFPQGPRGKKGGGAGSGQFAGVVGSAGVIPTQGVGGTSYQYAQQYINPGWPNPQINYAGIQAAVQAGNALPAQGGAQIPTQPSQVTVNNGGVSVSMPTSSAGPSYQTPTGGYTYGGYNPATQQVNYVNNQALAGQGQQYDYAAMLASGIAPNTMSVADQWNLGYTSQQMQDMGYLLTSWGQWQFVAGGAYDPEIPDQAGGTGPGGYSYPKQEYQSGYAGMTGRGRGITGYDRAYGGAIGPISWRV